MFLLHCYYRCATNKDCGLDLVCIEPVDCTGCSKRCHSIAGLRCESSGCGYSTATKPYYCDRQGQGVCRSDMRIGLWCRTGFKSCGKRLMSWRNLAFDKRTEWCSEIITFATICYEGVFTITVIFICKSNDANSSDVGWHYP